MHRIKAEKISKKFFIGASYSASVIGRVARALSGKETRREFWALRDISLSVSQGEMVGIVGKNGAGKSTLLSIIAGIYPATCGTLSVRGKVVSMIGLVNGLKDRLTARENIYLCCALYGLHKSAVKEKEIFVFAGLERYHETKLYQFSTGMIARLIFSIAIHCDPDILLLDEVTSNLDKEFIGIVTNTVERLSKKGVAMMVVSHQPWVIERCDKVLWLDKGVLVMQGNSEEIIKSYWSNEQLEYF